MLIFATNLEKVEEVSGGCLDGDEVLIWLRGGVGKGADSEVAGTGHVGFHLDGAHVERSLSGNIMDLNTEEQRLHPTDTRPLDTIRFSP